ncbi:hypothetical protein ABT076_10450 [Streptomyces sp. NPDC002131]|uniref:hypothetical protein n=1 Tax=Streptomyces sp. NPDC002131 TaxID=3154535 RepID=UPI00331FBEDE
MSEPTNPAPIEFLPALWYTVTARDDNDACENSGKEFEVNPCYSNGGLVVIECGRCRQPMEIVAATLLDPQPEVS